MYDIKSFKKTYAGKKVLITGHTGFKGSHLSIWLKSLGAIVIGVSDTYYSNENRPKGLNWLANVVDIKNRADKEYCIDLGRGPQQISRVIHDEKPDFIFHLAAQPLVKKSYDKPYLTFNTNVMGTINVLDAVHCFSKSEKGKDHKIALVCVTTDKCYKNVEQIWGYRETDPLGGNDPYSASKAAAEIVINSYIQSFFKHNPNIGCASARSGNVVGGGDASENRLIPDCFRSITKTIKSGEVNNIVLRNPNATRPWLHVLEPLSGYMRLAEAIYENPNRYSGAYNFGPPLCDNKSVKYIVDMFMDNFAGTVLPEVICEKSDIHPEAGLLNLDTTYTALKLGWMSRWDVGTALDKTAVLYVAMQKDRDYTLKTVLKHINDYTNECEYIV